MPPLQVAAQCSLNWRLDHVMVPLAEDAPDLTLEQIQRRLEQELVRRGEQVIGWKVGFSNLALQGRSNPSSE